MNKFLIVLIAIVGLSATARAQSKGANEFGVTAGLNTASVTSGNYSNGDYRIGFNAGIALDHYFSDSWSIKGKLLYDQKGWNNGFFFSPETDAYSTDYKLDYISIPVQANWHFGRTKNWYLNFGPYLGVLLNASTTANKADAKALFNTVDGGLGVGIGIKFPVSDKTKFFIEIDGQGGISDIVKDNKGIAIRNTVTHINLGFNF